MSHVNRQLYRRVYHRQSGWLAHVQILRTRLPDGDAEEEALTSIFTRATSDNAARGQPQPVNVEQASAKGL